ncbi:MAG: hypothetical protein ABIZ34_04775 [Candidatus Limnocylindrales bacterium]
MTGIKSVDDIMDRLPSLSADEIRVLRGVWNELDASQRPDAWLNVKATLVHGGLWSDYEALQDAVTTWVSDFATGRAGFDGLTRSSDSERLEQRIAAVPPILDAAAALLCGDGLMPSERDLLLEPWLAATDSKPVETTSRTPRRTSR